MGEKKATMAILGPQEKVRDGGIQSFNHFSR